MECHCGTPSLKGKPRRRGLLIIHRMRTWSTALKWNLFDHLLRLFIWRKVIVEDWGGVQHWQGGWWRANSSSQVAIFNHVHLFSSNYVITPESSHSISVKPVYCSDKVTGSWCNDQAGQATGSRSRQTHTILGFYVCLFVCFFVCLFVWKSPPTTPTESPRPAPPPPVPTNATYLFNLADDPEERIDLSSERPDLVLAMVTWKFCLGCEYIWLYILHPNTCSVTKLGWTTMMTCTMSGGPSERARLTTCWAGQSWHGVFSFQLTLAP